MDLKEAIEKFEALLRPLVVEGRFYGDMKLKPEVDVILTAARAELARREGERPSLSDIVLFRERARNKVACVGCGAEVADWCCEAWRENVLRELDILKALRDTVVPWLRKKGTLNFEADCAEMLRALGELP